MKKILFTKEYILFKPTERSGYFYTRHGIVGRDDYCWAMSREFNGGVSTVGPAFDEELSQKLEKEYQQELENKKMESENKYEFITSEEFTVEELAMMISDKLSHDDCAKFVAFFDLHCENWGVTVELIRHFKHLKNIAKKELDKGEYDFSAKNMLDARGPLCVG